MVDCETRGAKLAETRLALLLLALVAGVCVMFVIAVIKSFILSRSLSLSTTLLGSVRFVGLAWAL